MRRGAQMSGRKVAGHEKVRWSLAVLVVLLSVVTVCYAILKYRQMPTTDMLPDLPYNDFTKPAIDLILEQSRTLFQGALLVMAAIAGLLVTNPKEASLLLTDIPELMMSTASVILLILSVICYVLYLRQVEAAYAVAAHVNDLKSPSMPDVLSGSIEYLFYFQAMFVLSGLLTAGLALLCVHRVKKKG